ncbi:MAG: peroxiredoxin [Aquificaceae bacterium]|nr:peroxiredoxin [Aquificaceae bacterium]MDW8237732.1 peroxiredoxin [Aquificaceae bacterium]
MKSFLSALFGLIGMSVATINEGMPAYMFSLLNQDGKKVTLADLAGKWVVLYFYPKADTPGCTAQAKEYSKLIKEFDSYNAVVFGVSTDSVESIKKFSQKYSLKVNLLSDPKGEVAKAYGVRVLMGFCSRDTIVIAPDMRVAKIYRGVDPNSDPVKVLEFIKSSLR